MSDKDSASSEISDEKESSILSASSSCPQSEDSDQRESSILSSSSLHPQAIDPHNSANEEDINGWEKMTTFPFPDFSDPIQLNNKQFVVLPNQNKYCFGDGVYSFNIDHNKWLKIMDYDKYTTFYLSGIAFNEKTQSIYTILGKPRMSSSVYKFDLKAKTCQQIGLIKSCDQMSYINGKIHLINYRSQRHFIWNEQTNFFYLETEEISQFPCDMSLNPHINIGYGPTLKYLKSANKLLLFGGNESDSIYEFCPINKNWQKLTVEMPKKISYFGVVSTRYDQYIIIFGGSPVFGHVSEAIFFCDMNTKCMFESKVKCPKRANYGAFITNDINGDNLLCFGYIAHCFKAMNMKNVNLSLDIVQLIVKLVCFQTVHLIQYKTGRHYKMNVDHILQSL